MDIRKSHKYCIITPLSPKLTEHESSRIKNEILNSNPLRIGIDMSFVQDCTIDFIKTIAQFNNISFFNVQSDIFALFTSMNLDKTLSLFVSEIDFLDNKRRLLNRQFSLV